MRSFLTFFLIFCLIKLYYSKYETKQDLYLKDKDRQRRMKMERFYAYDYLIGDPILVDTEEKTLTFFSVNIHGQLYDLESGGDQVKISKAKMNGLIKRLNHPKYSYSNSLAIDPYVFHLLLTEEQREKCKRIASAIKQKELYASGNDYKEVITTMCEKVFDQHYNGNEENKATTKEKLMEYYSDVINQLSSAR